MAIAFQCPHCQKAYKVKDELIGKKSACMKCKQIIVVPAVSQPTAVGESQALESLASNVLADEPQNGVATVAAAATPTDDISLECPFCFEKISFAGGFAGKQQPCPECRRIIKVPESESGQPKDWRTVENTLTMIRKDDGPAPEGAWGNTAKAQAIVSREALLEAKVVKDRKELARPDRTKWYVAMAMVAIVGGSSGWWLWRGKAADDRRLGLVADADQATESKTESLPSGWSSAIQAAIGSFYLNEESPDIKSAVKHLRLARSGAQQVDSALDKGGMLMNVAAVQSRLVGNDQQITAGRALPLEEAQKELRQTLQTFKELPKEDGWLAIESMTRQIGTAGPKRPMMSALAPVTLPTEADRAESLACVALMLLSQSKGDPAAIAIADEAAQMATTTSDGKSAPRVVALMVARKQLGQARQLLAEPMGEEASLNSRLAYSEGYARTGDLADLEKARKIATGNGSVEHQVAAMSLLADAIVDVHDGKDLDSVVNFVADRAKKFTLPSWALIRLANCCERAKRPDLARILADSVSTPGVKSWVELAALRAELKNMTKPAESALGASFEDKSAAQGLAWVAIARHNTKLSSTDPRIAIDGWSGEQSRSCGYIGAALGLQDRAR